MNWPQEETRNLILTVLIKNPETYRAEIMNKTVILAEEMQIYQRATGRTSPSAFDYIDGETQNHILKVIEEVLEELKISNNLVEDEGENLILE